MITSYKRLQKELQGFIKEPVSGIQASLTGEDVYSWKAVIDGPTGTPYSGQKLTVNLTFPKDYPYKGPHLVFEPPIWHPNVCEKTGNVCLDILSTNWSAALTLRTLLLSVQSFLADPNVLDPLNKDAAKATKDKKLYKKQIKSFKRKWKNCND